MRQAVQRVVISENENVDVDRTSFGAVECELDAVQCDVNAETDRLTSVRRVLHAVQSDVHPDACDVEAV